MLPDAYASAVNAGVQTDAVAAAGWARKRHSLGVLLQRLRADPTSALLAAAHGELVPRLRAATRDRQVQRRAREIVAGALQWWLDSTCRACGRLGWLARHARMTDVACRACAASGLRDLPGGEPAAWVVAFIERAVSESEGAHRRAMR